QDCVLGRIRRRAWGADSTHDPHVAAGRSRRDSLGTPAAQKPAERLRFRACLVCRWPRHGGRACHMRSTLAVPPAPRRGLGAVLVEAALPPRPAPGVPAPAPTFDAPLTLGAQIEARAAHPDVAGRVFLRQHDRTWTYRRYRDESVRLAHFLRTRLGRIDDDRPGHVAMFLENHLELLALYGGCGYAGLTLFGVNTGLRGD